MPKMPKMLKKPISLLLTAALLLGLCLPVAATDPATAAEAESVAEAQTEAKEAEGDEEAENTTKRDHDINDDEAWDPAAVTDGLALLAETDTVTTELSGLTLGSTGSGADGAAITATVKDGGFLLVLPATADPTAVTLTFSGRSSLTVSGNAGNAGNAGSVTVSSGNTINLTELCGEVTDPAGEGYSLTLTATVSSWSLRVLISDGVAAAYLTSDDPENQGREWVEASATKENKATGSLLLQNPDGSLVYSGALTQIKGRGNSTWSGAKRPYQIKLSSKTDLLETGDKNNKNKTWVLLANYYDGSLLHNALTNDLAVALGLESTIEYRFVDLYYDGIYRGSYLLCEKVAIDSGRVDIHDLESDNEDANPEIDDFSVLTSVSGTTENGATYYYREGMASPEDISGGYLLEMDYADRAKEEACYFVTAHSKYITVKSPEYCSREEMEYIAGLYQEFEDAVYNGGTNPTTGKSLSDYMDLESAAQLYLINELSKNPDSFLSSAYVYKDAGSDLFRMGPAWDYDLAYGYGNYTYSTTSITPTGWFASGNGIAPRLTSCLEFRAAIYKVWTEQLAPLVGDVLLGDVDAVDETGSLHSLLWYEDRTAATAACNYALWSVHSYTGNYPAGRSYSENIAYLNSWLATRYSWLEENLADKYYVAPCTDNEHTLVTVSTVAPTCTTDGSTTQVCSTCGAELTSVVPRIFLDTKAGKYYSDALESFYARGIVKGVSDIRFGTEDPLTRAMLVTLLHRMAGSPECTEETPFTDIGSSSYYTEAVRWAYACSVVNGTSATTFSPNASILRQDLAVILYRYAAYLGYDVNTSGDLAAFVDADSVSGYAEAAMTWAVEAGIIKGTSATKLNPRGNTTRAQAITMLYRFESWMAANPIIPQGK